MHPLIIFQALAPRSPLVPPPPQTPLPPPFTAYRIQHSGALSVISPAPSAPLFSHCVSAFVFEWDASRPYHPSSIRKAQPAQKAWYFVGRWSSLPLDPSSWGLGKEPSHQHIVREAAKRLILIRAITQTTPLLTLGTPLRPRIWEDDWNSPGTPVCGLRCVESRWEAAAEGALSQPQPRIRSRAEMQGGDPEVEAVWMRPSSGPRLHWGQRTANAPPPPPARPGRPVPSPISDTLDLLASPAHNPPVPWMRVWIRTQGLLTDRRHRALAWRILHGAVFCGAFKGYINKNLPRADLCCPRPCCSSIPETLTHLFLTCPVPARVITWVCDLWVAIIGGGSRPIPSAAVFLADDTQVWDPGTQHADLWNTLRLTTLYHIWAAACQRRKGVISNPASVVASIVYSLRARMSRDYHRTVEDIRMHASILSDWLRGRDPCISLDHFKTLWGPPGGLYLLDDSDDNNPLPIFRILLSCTTPIPVPRGGENH